MPLIFFFISDDKTEDKEPPDEQLHMYKHRLNDLAKILDDVYPPSESHKINKKLTKMGVFLFL